MTNVYRTICALKQDLLDKMYYLIYMGLRCSITFLVHDIVLLKKNIHMHKHQHCWILPGIYDEVILIITTNLAWDL